jgi:hypothetical protein
MMFLAIHNEYTFLEKMLFFLNAARVELLIMTVCGVLGSCIPRGLGLPNFITYLSESVEPELFRKMVSPVSTYGTEMGL